MNVEMGTGVAQFPEKKYINGIFVAVWWDIVSREEEVVKGGNSKFSMRGVGGSTRGKSRRGEWGKLPMNQNWHVQTCHMG